MDSLSLFVKGKNKSLFFCIQKIDNFSWIGNVFFLTASQIIQNPQPWTVATNIKVSDSPNLNPAPIHTTFGNAF